MVFLVAAVVITQHLGCNMPRVNCRESRHLQHLSRRVVQSCAVGKHDLTVLTTVLCIQCVLMELRGLTRSGKTSELLYTVQHYGKDRMEGTLNGCVVRVCCSIVSDLTSRSFLFPVFFECAFEPLCCRTENGKLLQTDTVRPDLGIFFRQSSTARSGDACRDQGFGCVHFCAGSLPKRVHRRSDLRTGSTTEADVAGGTASPLKLQPAGRQSLQRVVPEARSKISRKAGWMQV